jgi:tRNA dimethylallyltransferase
MIEAGLVNEVESILKIKRMDTSVSSMRSVGYRQVCEFLEGNISYDEMIFKGVTATRQLAKRQMTWLRSWKNLTWLNESSKDMSQEILDKVSNEL